MMVDNKAHVLSYTGDPVTNSEGATVTIGDLIRGVVNTPVDEPWTPESLLKCGDIAHRASSNDKADFNDEERSFIKARAAHVYSTGNNSPLFYGAIHAALSDAPAPLP